MDELEQHIERHNQDLNNLYKQMGMLVEMYDDLSNVEVIGIMTVMINRLASQAARPVNDK
jgi:hypothetical protein